MRTLHIEEVMEVSAAAGVHLPTVVNSAMDFAATGVLLNIVLNGVTAATIGQGILLGAGVGASYALVRSVIYS